MYKLPLTAEELKEKLLKVTKLSADAAIHKAAYESSSKLIRITLGHPVEDGADIKFRAPVNCTDAVGLIVYYPNAEGEPAASVTFDFVDANGNDVGDVNHLFAENAIVKVILDLDTNSAFIQNADTNAYLEGRLNQSIIYSEQELDEDKKAQARANIGAIGEEQLEAAVTALVNSAPETLDTLSELASALGNDKNFAATIAGQIGELDAKIGEKPVADQIVAATGSLATTEYVDTKVSEVATKEIPIQAGSGERYILIGEGMATGDYSIAGGTVNKQLVTDLVGTAVDDYISIDKSEANGGMSIAYGAGNIAHSSASNTFGIKNQSGWLGYYIYKVDADNRRIYLSTKQTSHSRPGISVDALNTAWVGCKLTAINGDLYSNFGEVEKVEEVTEKVLFTNTTYTVVVTKEALPFTDVNYGTLAAYVPHDRSIIAIPPVGTQTYLGNTFDTYRPDSVGEVEFAFSSTTFGFDNIAAGTLSTAFGFRNTALGTAAFVTGRENTGAFASLVGGYQNTVTGGAGFAVGRNNKVVGEDGSAEGYMTEAGYRSHAEGRETVASGTSHAEGFGTLANNVSHAEGQSTEATGLNAHAEGQSSIASGAQSHAEGLKTKANSAQAHAEGNATIALGNQSHAEGNNTQAGIYKTNEEGLYVNKDGNVLENQEDISVRVILGHQSHTEGSGTKAVHDRGHAEGQNTIAGYNSHAEGNGSEAQGTSHAEGLNTKATNVSHAEGYGTVASGAYQHTQGKFNIEDTENKFAHIIGNGLSNDKRSNAHTVDWDGNAWFAGDVTVGENNDTLAKQKCLEELTADVHTNYANAYKKVVTGNPVELTEVSPVKHPIKCAATASDDSLSGKWLFLGDNTSIFEQHPGEYHEVSGSIKLLHGNDIVDVAVIIFDNMHLAYFKSDNNDITYSFVSGDILVFESVSSNTGIMASILQACTVPLVDIACSTTPIDINCYIEHFAPEKDKDGCYRQAFTLEKPLVKGNKYFISADNLKSATGQGCLIYAKEKGTIGNLLENTSGKSVLEITSAYDVDEIYIYSGKDFSDGCKKQATLDNFIIESNGVSEVHLAKNTPIEAVESISPIMYIASRNPSVSISAEYNVDIVKMLENVSKPASQVQIITWEDED